MAIQRRLRLDQLARCGVALGLLLALEACATAPGPAASPGVPGIPAPANVPDPSRSGPTILIRLDVGRRGFGTGQHRADYLSDGTVIRWTDVGSVCQPAQPCGTLQRNTMTASGLAAVHTLLANDADLLSQPANLAHLPSGKSMDDGSDITTFVLERPDRSRYTVIAPTISPASSGAWAADSAITRLGALSVALADPTTLVGSEGMANPTWTTYQPAKTAVFVKFVTIFSNLPPTPNVDRNGNVGMPFAPPDVPDINSVGWPFAGAPDGFGGDFSPASSGSTSDSAAYRCSFLPSADALTAIASLPREVGTSYAAGELAAGGNWQSGALRWSAKGPTAGLGLVAVSLLPEDATGSCADAFSY